MEPGLIPEPQGGGHGEGQLGVGRAGRVDAQAVGGLRLPVDGPGVPGGVEVGRAVGKVAVDAPLPDHTAVFRHGPLVSLGVEHGLFPAELVDEPLVDEAVLGGDLGGGAPGLATSGPGGLQHHRLQPRRPEKMGGEDAGQPAADDGGVYLPVPRQGLPRP